MKLVEFKAIYDRFGYDENIYDKAVSFLNEMESYLSSNRTSFEDASLEKVKQYIDYIVVENKNELQRFLALARYFYVLKRNDIYIYFTTLLGGLGVFENIRSRIEEFEGEAVANKVFENVIIPPLGTDTTKTPEYTNKLMKSISEHLPIASCKKILAGNNHGIPKESMQVEKELYEKAENLDVYLKERHQRRVLELQKYCDEGKVWFEQIITQEVVEHVRTNQEVLSAVRKDDTLYVTKIPYETQQYLTETDPIKKRYYYCHCTLAREAILNDSQNIDPNWCYCSAGFAKFPFEVILGKEEMEVTVLESVLSGSDKCRFAIKLINY